MSENKIMKNHQISKLGFTSEQQYTFPTIVNLCVIRGDCPCRCVHCPVGLTQPSERHKRFGNTDLSLDLFDKIIQEMSAFHHSTLRIHGVGEPLLWGKLHEALQFASEHKVRTWLFTCLIHHDNNLLREIAANCDIIEVSINSYDAENYLQTKGIDGFKTVKMNLEFVRDFVVKNNLSTRIIGSRVESEHCDYDDEFLTYWKNTNLLDDVFIRSYHDYNSLLKSNRQRGISDIIPCLVHWNRFNIDCDGTAVLCFNELFKANHSDSQVVLGNVTENTIRDIWVCEKLNIVREAQMKKDYSSVAFADALPCIGCLSCQPIGQNARPTSELQINAFKSVNKR
ncbi:MAG: radical SAM protein [Nitrospirae bacterium]|nr:radical SAM protein [Nitrospirota bacterium]